MKKRDDAATFSSGFFSSPVVQSSSSWLNMKLWVKLRFYTTGSCKILKKKKN